MKLERLPGSELAALAARIAELLAGDELSWLDEHVRAELITALGSQPTELASQTALAEAIADQKKAAFSTRDVTHRKVVKWTRRVRDLLKAVDAPKGLFDVCGLEYAAPRSNTYIAQDPTDMAAVGFSNGVNKIGYVGNNRHGLVVYEIWRRVGRDGTWQKHDLSRKQKYEDHGVTPGQYYEYRVRAVAAKTTSAFSNSTIVYGVL